MRADLTPMALADESNRYQLTECVAKVTRMLHRPNTRVQDTMNEAFKWLGRFKPGAAKALHSRNPSQALFRTFLEHQYTRRFGPFHVRCRANDLRTTCASERAVSTSSPAATPGQKSFCLADRSQLRHLRWLKSALVPVLSRDCRNGPRPDVDKA